MNIGVVLLNWNTGDFTQVCLEFLFAADRKPDHVVIVDNASTDGSPDRLAAAWPGLILLRQSTNTGFAGGNNIGIRHLLEHTDCDLVWILNNDTEVAPDCLSLMATALADDPELGAVTGKMLYPPEDHDGQRKIWYGGGDVSPWTLEATHWGQDELDGPAVDSPADVTFLSGCSMLIRRSVLEQLGGFDNQFFIYCEDVDWSLRATAAGIRMRYLPAAELLHRVSASTKRNTLGDAGGQISPFAHYLLARNRRFVIRRHGRGLKRLVATGRYQIRQLWFFIGLSLRKRREKLAAMRRGVRDGAKHGLQPAGNFEASDDAKF